MFEEISNKSAIIIDINRLNTSLTDRDSFWTEKKWKLSSNSNQTSNHKKYEGIIDLLISTGSFSLKKKKTEIDEMFWNEYDQLNGKREIEENKYNHFLQRNFAVR